VRSFRLFFLSVYPFRQVEISHSLSSPSCLSKDLQRGNDPQKAQNEMSAVRMQTTPAVPNESPNLALI
jgi:hypothetical protein